MKAKKEHEKIEETAKKDAEKAMKASMIPAKPFMTSSTPGAPPRPGGLPGFGIPGAAKLPVPSTLANNTDSNATSGLKLPMPGQLGGGFKLPPPG